MRNFVLGIMSNNYLSTSVTCIIITVKAPLSLWGGAYLFFSVLEGGLLERGGLKKFLSKMVQKCPWPFFVMKMPYQYSQKTLDQMEIAGSTTLRRGNFDYQSRVNWRY